MRYIVAALLFLTACGPVYTTEYQMVPPKSQSGQMCASNCILAAQNCKLACENSSLQCQQGERYRAENEYLKYKNERIKAGKEVKRSENSFYSSYRCDTDDCDARCDDMMHACYTTCGGQIIPHTYCSAFCK